MACPSTITNIIQSYVRNGIKDITRYNISPNFSATLCKVDGHIEAHIIQIACGPAPEEKAYIELEGSVGRETIRETLKVMSFDLAKNSDWCIIPPKRRDL